MRRGAAAKNRQHITKVAHKELTFRQQNQNQSSKHVPQEGAAHDGVLIDFMLVFFPLFCSQMSRYSSLRVQLREIWLNIYKYIYIKTKTQWTSVNSNSPNASTCEWMKTSVLTFPFGDSRWRERVGRAVYLLRSKISQPEKKIQQKDQISQTLDWLFSSLKDRKIFQKIHEKKG